MSEPPSEGEGSRTRAELLLAWVHIGVLWAFAFTKPLFDVLAESPDFFVARGNTGGDIVLFALGLTLVPPTLLVGVEALFVRWPTVRRGIHLVIIGALVAALALQLLGELAGGPATLLLVAAAAIGAGAAVIYARVAAARSVLTVLGPAPVLFLVLFLLVSNVSKLILPQDEAADVKASVGGNTPVVVVVLDEFAGYALRDARGRVDASRYPNFAALAKGATWYRNATTVTDGTTHAVPAILSGRVPEKEDLPIASDYPQNLFTILGGRYALNVNERATALCPERLCGNEPRGSARSRLRALADDLSLVSLHLLLPDDLDKHLDPVDQTFGGFRHATDTDTASNSGSAGSGQADTGIPSAAFEDRGGQWERTTARVDSSPRRPTFTFLHVLLPHEPWVRLPSGQEYAAAGPVMPGLEGDTWGSDALLAQQSQQRFLLQVGYVDRLLGRLVKKLKDRGMYDRSMLVVTADHGVSFQAGHPRRAITEETLGDIAPVPLFVKLPGQRSGHTDDRMARTVDIVPTIADQLNIRLDDHVDGRSLLSPAARPEGQVTVSATHGPSVSVPFATFKRERDIRVGHMLDVFGAGDGWASLFGTAGDAAPAATGSSGVRIALDAPGLLASVDPRAAVIPAFVTGVLSGSVSPGDRFAVAVNGRMAGTSSAYSAGSDIRVGVLVPPALLHAGSNRVAVFSVDGQGGATRFAGVERTDSELQASLAETGGHDVIREPGGKTIRVVAAPPQGSVDALTVQGRVITATGWAIDEQRKRPVEQVLVFAGDRLIASGRPSVARPDIADKFGPGFQLSGFELTGVSPGASADTKSVRIFAVSGTRAWEMPTKGAPTSS